MVGVTVTGPEGGGSGLEVGGGHGVQVVGVIVTGPEGGGATSPMGGVVGVPFLDGLPVGKGLPA